MRELVHSFMQIEDWKDFLAARTKDLLRFQELVTRGFHSYQENVRTQEELLKWGTQQLAKERVEYDKLFKVCPMGHDYFEDSGDVWEIRDRVVIKLKPKRLLKHL